MIDFKLHFHFLNTFDTSDKLHKNLKGIFEDTYTAKAVVFLLKENTTICKNLFKNLNKPDTVIFLKEYLDFKLNIKKTLSKNNPYYFYENYQKKLHKNLINSILDWEQKNHIKTIILPIN